MSALTCVWHWAKQNDLPNWFTFVVAGVLWPLAVFAWQRRKTSGVPGLEVHLQPGNITIGGQPFPAIDVQFTNHTQSVVYVTSARIRKCTAEFPVPIQAARDIARDSYHLKFMDTNTGQFNLREVTLQTSMSQKTCMPAAKQMPPEFFQPKPSRVRRWLRWRKYFVIEYTAMVGDVRHFVATAY